MFATFFILALLAVSANANAKCTYDNKEMTNNEVLTVQNAFRIKCITEDNGSWRTEIVGCVTPDGKEVEVGKKSEADDKIFECIKNEAGQVVLKETKGSKANCQGGHKFGEEWQEKSFKFTCAEGGVTKFTACVGQDGSVIKVGESGKIGGFEIKCEQHANGTITMQAANDPKSYECTAKDGTKKKNGEEYKEGNFVRKCGDFGMGKIVGCTADGVTETIPLNQNVTVGEIVHSCVKDGDKFSFRTFGKQKPSVYAVCAYDGKQYENGTTFIAQNAFRMRCLTFENLTSTFEIVSCITPAGLEIPVGAKIEEGDRVFECTSGNITLKSTPGKNGKCRGVYDVGQTWVEDSFKLRCEPYGKVTLTSCITKENVEIPLGETRRVPAGFVMECATIDGNVALRAAKNAQCNASNGEEKQIGQSWHDGNFVRRCSEYGIANISGCFVDDLEFGLNQNYTSGNLVHMCIHNGDQYSFRTISIAPSVVTVKTTIQPQSDSNQTMI